MPQLIRVHILTAAWIFSQCTKIISESQALLTARKFCTVFQRARNMLALLSSKRQQQSHGTWFNARQCECVHNYGETEDTFPVFNYLKLLEKICIDTVRIIG